MLIHTAAPRDLFNTLNCIPDISATTPINPSKASTSLTMWPLPIPPIEGYNVILINQKYTLHDISPIVSKLLLIKQVLKPILAETAAASHPAWPPPTTITS